MYGLPIQKNYVAFYVLPSLIGDFASEDQVKLTTDVLVPEKCVRSGVGRDSIQNQLAFSLTRQAGHGKTVAEVAPLELIQRSEV
jgi:hypothetical protein